MSTAGAAVVSAMLLLLALTALAHGALLLARQEVAAARAGVRLLQARTAAQAGALVAVGSDLPADSDTTPLWGSVSLGSASLGRVSFRWEMRRLSRELWLAEGAGWHADGLESRAGRAVWVMDPLARTAAFDGVVVVADGAPVDVTGVVDGDAISRAELPLTPALCSSWQAALDSIYPTGRLPSVAVQEPDPRPPRLGLLDGDSLLASIPVQVSGLGTPAPAEEGGTCLVDAPWSWGDPDRPYGACGGHLALRASPGDLTLEGGVGQGLLVVAGDLTLVSGARFFGIVLVAGVLRVVGGARLAGLAQAHGGLEVGPASEIRGSACWTARALDAARPYLSLPLAIRESGWIGPM